MNAFEEVRLTQKMQKQQQEEKEILLLAEYMKHVDIATKAIDEAMKGIDKIEGVVIAYRDHGMHNGNMLKNVHAFYLRDKPHVYYELAIMVDHRKRVSICVVYQGETLPKVGQVIKENQDEVKRYAKSCLFEIAAGLYRDHD